MKKVTFISGPQGSGKTNRAKQMAEGKNAVWLSNADLDPYGFMCSEVKRDTDLFIIEEAKFDHFLIDFIYCDVIKVNQPRKLPFTIDRPELIITTNLVRMPHISGRPWFEFIYLTELPANTEDSLWQLSMIQKQVGYKEGNINTVALLGLFGEAGEVLNEVVFINNTNGFSESVRNIGVAAAGLIDTLKKEVRDKAIQREVSFTTLLLEECEEKFDMELADTLYYLNALAINRGKTLGEYAEASYKKVLAKGQQNISHGNPG
jgi:hypothetical protein